MDLSPIPLHPVGILDIPEELLTQVAAHFQHPAIHGNKIEADHDELQDVQDYTLVIKNMRLVCRTFNRAVSRFLYPILRAQLDAPSLRLTETVVENPLLVAGVRRIQLRLGYRFEELASDKSLFLRSLRAKIGSLFAHHHQCRLKGNSSVRKLLGAKFPKMLEWSDKRELLFQRILACLTACDRYIGDGPSPHQRDYPAEDETLISEYMQVLDEAFENYQEKYIEQWRIVSERLLVKALARLASLVRHPISLSIVGPHIWKGYDTLFSEKQGALQWMSCFQEWQDISSFRGELKGSSLSEQAGIVLDLPISIYQQGGAIHSLELEYLPVTRAYTMVCQNDVYALNSKAWHDLRAACQTLGKFKIGGLGFDNKLDDNPPMIGNIPKGSVSFAKYLGAALSGPHLTRVEVNASSRELRCLNGWERYPLGPELTNLACTPLRALCLSQISISQGDLEGICQGLSPYVDKIHLSGIVLSQGSWEHVLDILRDKLKPSSAKTQRVLRLEALSGGGTVQLKDEVRDLCPLRETLSDPADFHVAVVFTKYIEGNGVAYNPMRAVDLFRSLVVESIRQLSESGPTILTLAP